MNNIPHSSYIFLVQYYISKLLLGVRIDHVIMSPSKAIPPKHYTLTHPVSSATRRGRGGAAIEAVLLLLLFTTSSAAAASAAIAALIQDSQGRGYDEMAPAIERRTARLAGVFPPLFCGTA